MTAPGLLTPDAIRRAQEAIDRHMRALACILHGDPDVDPEAWKLALGLGIVAEGETPTTARAYEFGVFLAHVAQSDDHTEHYGTTAEDFVDAVKRDPVPLTQAEQAAAEYARTRAATYLKGLGNKVGATLGSKLIEADQDLRADMTEAINDAISAKFGDDGAAARMRDRARAAGKDETFYDGARRATIGRVVSDIGHATNDWSRDLRRIVQTETEKAMQEGLRDTWTKQAQEQAEEERRPVAPVLVAKVPRPDACDHCIRLHRDGDGNLRIFDLGQLAGTNVGRKARDWLVTVGPVHPHCACALIRIPRYISMPKGWTSGQAAPSVIGPDGRLVARSP